MFSYLFKYREQLPFLLLFILWTIVCHFNLIYTEVNVQSDIFYLLNRYFSNSYLPIGLFGVIVLFQAWVLNNLFNKNELCKTDTNLPAAFYVLFIGILNVSWVLEPAFLALTFIVFAISSYINSYQKKSFAHLFNNGFFIGIATVMYPPSIVYLIAVFVAHFFLRLFSIKEWLTTIIGFIVPIYLFFVGLYFTDNLDVWFAYFSKQNYFNFKIIAPNTFTELVSLVTLAICVLFGLYKYQLRYLRTSMENRDKLVICLYFLLASMFITIVWGANWQYNLLLALPLVSIFMAYGVYNSKKMILTEVLPLCLLLVVLFLHHLSEYFAYLNFFNL